MTEPLAGLLFVPPRVHVARLLDRLSRACKRGADRLYKRHSRIESAKAQRAIDADQRLADALRRRANASRRN